MAEEDVRPRYEMTRAFIATLRLAQLDMNAIDLFEKTPQAAWRALRFVFYSLPFIMLISWWDSAEFVKVTSFTPLTFSLLRIEQALIALFGFMLIVHQLGQRLGYNKHFAQYVTAQFSVALPVTLILTALISTWRLAGVEGDGAQLLGVLIYAVQIVIDWAVTCAALRLRPGIAFGISVMNVLFNMLIQLAMTLAVYLSLSPSVAGAVP